MTNHTFKVLLTQQTRPYQGFPYVNPAYTDAPSVPPAEPATAPITDQPTTSRTAAARPRPAALELNETQTATSRPGGSKPISQAQRELQERYGRARERLEEVRPEESVTSPYVDETIFYDPFENRRIAHPKDSPSPETRIKPHSTPPQNQSDEDSDDTEALPSVDTPRYTASPGPSSSIRPGPSVPAPMTPVAGSSAEPTAAPYYMKEAGLYGRSPSEVLPELIPADRFPEPPPAYTEIDQGGTVNTLPSAAVLPPPTTQLPATELQATPVQDVITTPTPTVGQNPSELYNPSRKYVTCQFCRQHVLTIIKKESGILTHMTAALCCCFGWFPCSVCVYCTDICKETRHYCPNCDLLVEKVKRDFNGRIYNETIVP